jgi:hypothetical protein
MQSSNAQADNPDDLSSKRHTSSYRDRSGFIFTKDGALYRAVSHSYQDNYKALISSGLYKQLADQTLLISHQEMPETFVSLIKEELGDSFDTYKVLQPELIPFISYPYEWSFSALKSAALLTLKLEEVALDYNLTLKDATPYNVQFFGARPIFIDTLSFEQYLPGTPWIAYKQFCEQFLAPLALLAKVDSRISRLLVSNLDGIELDFATKLLPFTSKFSLGLLTHIHLHAKAQQKFANNFQKATKKIKAKISLHSRKALIDSLRTTIQALNWCFSGRFSKSEWANYYDDTNYSKQATLEKTRLVAEMIEVISENNSHSKKTKIAWDFGANVGVYSDLLVKAGYYTVAWDVDAVAVEKNFLRLTQGANQLSSFELPLKLDIMNPSPNLGFMHKERSSLAERSHQVDLITALAMIHHLAISRNAPLADLSRFFSKLCKHLVIEFVPKEDSQVVKLLNTRKDIFDDYHVNGFETAFSKNFEILSSHIINGTSRKMYLMRSIACK